MSPHIVTNEQLVQFVLDELSCDETREIEQHIRQCEPCRETVERLKRLLDCAGRMAAVPADEQGIESANREVLRAAKTQSKDQPRRGVPSRAALFGRTIMSNRMMRLAVAAVVALAVILGLSLFTGDGTGKAYAKVVDQLHRAHTLTYSLVTMTGQENMPTVRMDIAFSDAGRFRSATADGYVTVLEVMGNGVKGISLVPPTKSYVAFEMANVPDDPARDPWATVERLRALPARASKALGPQRIDGRTLDGFTVQEDDATTTVWIDPKTGQLVRAELQFAGAPGMNMILSDFQFDVLLEESFFRLTPPEGYLPVQVSADASQVGEQDCIEFLRFWSKWTVDGSFPPTVNGPDIAKIAVQMGMEGKFVAPCPPGYNPDRQKDIMYRGMVFISRLSGGTWRYAGQNVRFGDPTTPILWYQPAGSAAYRVIYADLHVATVTPESLPK